MNTSDLFKNLYKPRPNALKVISLGWGVQSWTLAAMVALGELDPVAFAIHADTTFESSWTYEFAKKQTPWLEAHGVKVVTVTPNSNEGMSQFDKWKTVFIPAYGLSDKGIKSMLSRQCTFAWKISPIRRYYRSVRKPKQPVEQWLGITTDEIQRIKQSTVKYIYHRWPLVEKGMSRTDCINWLINHNLEVPKRSSCTFCPYHDFYDWRLIMECTPDRKEAMHFDQKFRNSRPDLTLYLHKSLKPIDQVDFRTPEEQGQLSLWNNECDGLCGL